MTAWRRADPGATLTGPADALDPRETTFARAQEHVNFVVFEPGWHPGDCRVEAVTRRPERPPGRPDSGGDPRDPDHSQGNPPTLRAVVVGDGRRLRVKQFLYSMAPPAASVAPLWETEEPTPVTCDDAVGWLGRDYKDNRGACVQRRRTQIEISVLDGGFDDGELRDLLAGLQPAAPDAASQVGAVPFHALSYWVRYACPPPAPPHGLWEHAPTRPYHACHPVAPFALDAQAVSSLALDEGVTPIVPVTPLVPTADEFALDSAVAFPDFDAVECLFRHRENGSDHLWLCAAAEGSPLAPTLPPEASAQPAETRTTVDLRGGEVHYAALTEEWGGWEAVWREDDITYAAWSGSSQHLDGERFRSLVGGLASA